jgi:hypothetical protein
MSISKVASCPLVLRTRTEPARLAAEVRLGTGSCPVAPGPGRAHRLLVSAGIAARISGT